MLASFCPKPTSKEWKLSKSLLYILSIISSEAYLEGMKTCFCYLIRYVNCMCPKPTSKEWKLPFLMPVYFLPNRPKPTSKEWKRGGWRIKSERLYSPKPTSKEWKLVRPRIFLFLISCPKPTSKEWKLPRTAIERDVQQSPKPTSKEWKLQSKTPVCFRGIWVRSLPRRNENSKILNSHNKRV